MMTVFQRYLVIQFPGWVLAAIVLYALHRWAGLPAGAGVVLWAAYVAKDLFLFRFLRKAYEPGPAAGAERLVGLHGRAASRGYVRVNGELWKASPADASRPPEEGDSVQVEAAQGMELVVRVVPARRRPASQD